jgi:thiaminase/transcriptional activator TenA
MLHDLLWRSNLDLATKCLKHPFVRMLGEGTLDPALFRAYVAQDAFFLRAFLKAYALALARSDDPRAIRTLDELISGVLEELEVHRSYAAELGIDLEQVAANPSCRAYTDFLLSTAWHAGLCEILAAMTPCMRLYAYLGGELAACCTNSHPYRRWIETYSGADFGRLAQELETLLDQAAADTPAVRQRYRYAMQCELAFFEGAYAPKSLPFH